MTVLLKLRCLITSIISKSRKNGIVWYKLFFFKNYLCWLHLIFVAVCGLSRVAVSRRYSLVAVCGLLVSVASLIEEHRL